MFGFAMPPFDGTQTPTDVSFLNDAPAGKNGFVRVQGEHFIDGSGKKLRLWGVNINFLGAFPAKEQASGIAARLAKFGFNAVRFHHYEGNVSPNGLWVANAIGSSRVKMPREMDAAQLDKMDFFISELIKRGIYINLNLHVARKTSEAEGVPFAAALPDKDKDINYFDPRIIELQNEFSRAILTHVNPYTGRALKDEPGVCAIEADNESSLLGAWLDGSLKMPPDYSERLRAGWNAWLAKKYNPRTLRAAWTEIDDPIANRNLFDEPLPPAANRAAPLAPPLANDEPRLLDAPQTDTNIAVALNALGRMQLATVTGATGTTTVDATSGPIIDGIVRPGITISLDRTGSVTWAFQVNRDGFDLQEGQPYTLRFWARADAPRRISANLWQDRNPKRFQGFTGYADLTTDWQQFSFVLRPTNPDPQHSRISWNFGNATGAVQLGQIELNLGGRIAAPDDWILGDVPLIDLKATPVWTARRDFAEFLGGIESAHVAATRKFLKELGVRVPIWHSQAQFGGWGGLARETQSDAIDNHAYWKHPDFGATGWSGTSWKVGNLSMTGAANNDPLSAFAHFRVAGKPYLMTEWNSGQPNDFGGETLLMAAAYAAWQDWAGVFVFDYHSSGDFARDKFEGFFSIDSHPVKMATAPTAALLFRRTFNGLPDVYSAQDSATLTLPRDWIWNEVANAPGGPAAAPVLKTWADAGAARSLPLEGKTYVRFGDGIFPRITRAESKNRATWLSDTNQIAWHARQNIWNLNAPRSKATIGFIGGQGSQQLDEFSVTMPRTQSNWAAISLSSLDGAAVEKSQSLLLTAVGKAENLGMTWNADRSSIGNGWGSGPTQVEGIGAEIQLLTNLKTARVWALDATGGQRSTVPSELKNGVLRFAIAPNFKTLWYQITN